MLPPKISIAILPFKNLSSDIENEYFSDGITEEIMSALAKIEGLWVTARTSSFAFKNKKTDVTLIGKKLGVNVLVEGSVKKQKSSVRITVKLINVKDGYYFGSESWNRSLVDIVQVEDEIALEIAEKIRENIGHFYIKEQKLKINTTNAEAYNCYLKAKFHLHKWTALDVEKAIDLFAKTIQLEPTFSNAYFGISNSYACSFWLYAPV